MTTPVTLYVYSSQKRPASTTKVIVRPGGHWYRTSLAQLRERPTKYVLGIDDEGLASRVLYDPTGLPDWMITEAQYAFKTMMGMLRRSVPAGTRIGFYNIPSINWNLSNFVSYYNNFAKAMTLESDLPFMPPIDIAMPACYLDKGYTASIVLPRVAEIKSRGLDVVPYISTHYSPLHVEAIPPDVLDPLIGGLIGLGITEFLLWDGFTKINLKAARDSIARSVS